MKPRSLALLRRHHQRAVWTRPLWIATAGLALSLLLIRLEVRPELRWYVAGGTLVLALLFRFWPRRTLRSTASALDARRGLNNRLEAVVELGNRTDPLAEAARAEVQAFLFTHPLPRPYGWIAGAILAVALLTVNIALLLPRAATNAPVALDTVPVLAPASAPAAAVADESLSRETPAASTASLSWITPDAETSASPQEEIPLSAEAESKTGLRQLTLHLALNGEARPPVAVPGDVEAGVKPVTLSLLLEAFETQPADLVTYYLQAELVRPPGIPAAPVWAPIVSSLQVVEIRPLRDEPVPATNLGDPASAVLQKVREMKRAQLSGLREAFALGHGLKPRSDPEWPDQVRAANARQTTLGAAIAAVAPTLTAAALPREAAELLAAAQTEMEKAAAGLARGDPAAAVPAQTRAAARLAATERVVAKTVLENRDRLAAEAAARAVNEPTLNLADLPPRETTPAGRLEKLVREQQAIAEQLASRTAAPEVFTEQDRIARTIAKLAAEQALPKDVTELLTSAAAAANEAAIQLNEKDELAATEPATRAAQTLSEALASLEAAGRERAVSELLAAQRLLNRAATDLQLATDSEYPPVARRASDRINAVQQDLQSAARGQQQQGSAEAARKLNELANRIAQSEAKKDLAAAAKPAGQTNPAEKQPEKEAVSQEVRELAQQAATAATALEKEAQTGQRALDQLRRAQANLNRIAGDALRPLRWVKPTSGISAEPTETVVLAAEATSEQGYSRLALQLTVNGEPRPPRSVPAIVPAGTHPVPIALALETLKVANGDTVSYLLTAERVPSAAEAGASPREVISTPVQLITIGTSSAAKKPAGDAPTPQADKELADAIKRLRAVQTAQREVVEHTFAAERTAASRKDRAWQSSVDATRAEQHKTAAALDALLKETASVSGTAAFMLRSLLSKAHDEMTAAETALQRSEPAAAAPPAVRALAILGKILDAGGPPPGGGISEPGSAGSGQPQPGGPSAEAPTSGGTPDPLGEARSNSTTDLYETVVESVQRTPLPERMTMPPPPGPGATPKAIREYAGLLAGRIEGVIRQAAAAESERKRVQVLTTANPSEAPPAYRPAVADYFEQLARDRPAPAPRTP